MADSSVLCDYYTLRVQRQGVWSGHQLWEEAVVNHILALLKQQ